MIACRYPDCAYPPCVSARAQRMQTDPLFENYRQKVANLEAALQESREKRDKLNDECNKLDRENRGLKKRNKSLIDRNDFLFDQLSASQSNHKKACEQSDNLKLIQERDNWKKDAELRSRNESWLRGLLEAIGGYFGKAARTDNTGIDTGEIFVSKLPDLVRDLFAAHKVDPRVAQLEAQLEKEKRAREIACRDNERLLNRLDQVKNAANGGYEKKIMNELNHGPGKGDKDRSPGWRKNYDEIDWQRSEATNGFRRHSMGQRKRYRANQPPPVCAAEAKPDCDCANI